MTVFLNKQMETVMGEKITRFEDLECWRQARNLVNEVYKLTSEPKLSEEYTVKNQLSRAALSSMSNIAEGFARHSRGDFIRFLDYSQSSTQEVKSILYAVVDLNLESKERVERVQKKCDQVRGLTLGLLKHVRDSANPVIDK